MSHVNVRIVHYDQAFPAVSAVYCEVPHEKAWIEYTAEQDGVDVSVTAQVLASSGIIYHSKGSDASNAHDATVIVVDRRPLVNGSHPRLAGLKV